MDIAFIASQILTVMEYGLLGLSYLVKRRVMVVILDIASMALGVIVYLLLGADLGMGMSIVILVANFYYLYQEKQFGEQKKLYPRDFVALGLVLFAILIIAVGTYDGWLSLLSVIATVLYEISIWQKNVKVYKFLGIPVAGSWMGYNAFTGNVAGVVMESLMLVASVVGYIRAVAAEKKDLVARRRKVARRSAAKAGGAEKTGKRKKVRKKGAKK